MFTIENSPLGLETYYLFQGKRHCSVIEKNGALYFLVTGRGYMGEICETRNEAIKKVKSFLYSLSHEIEDISAFNKELDAFMLSIIVENMGKEVGIL